MLSVHVHAGPENNAWTLPIGWIIRCPNRSRLFNQYQDDLCYCYLLVIQALSVTGKTCPAWERYWYNMVHTFRFNLPPRVAGPRKNIHMNAAYCLNCPASRFVQPIDDIDFRYCYQLLSGLGKLFDTFLFSLTLHAAAWPGRFNHGPWFNSTIHPFISFPLISIFFF